MANRKIAYVLATLLCLSGCITTSPATPAPVQPQKLKPAPPATHTYLDTFPFDPYPYVGSVSYEETGMLIGGGVLVAPRVVITAAHVTEGHDDIIYIEHDGDEYCIEEVIYYPTYTPNLLIHDIAIIILEVASDEVPVSLFDPNKDITYKRMNLTTVGFGTGRKRFSNYGMFWYYGRLIGRPEFMIMLPTEASIWFGDSGGAVLTPNRKLIGVMSYFMLTEKGKVFENGCASIEYYRDWLLEIMKERIIK